MRWSWCLAGGALVLAVLAMGAAAQPPPELPGGRPPGGGPPGGGPAEGWELYGEEGGCIGGSRCGDQGDEIRIPLENAPVDGIRFHAHDDVGETSDGHLRVRIDALEVAPDVDVAKEGQVYELPVAERQGRFLVIETRTDDEVVVEDIEIRYRGLKSPREQREWRAYPEEAGCIGGGRCRDQGSLIRVRLEDAPVFGVRFLAHDDVGERHRGHLRVWIDKRSLAKDIDVSKGGQVFNLQVEGIRGRYLVFEALTPEEVVVEEIQVQYSGLRDPWEKKRRGKG